MLILIPVDNNDIDEAQITAIDDAKYWALLEFSEGKVQKSSFFDNYTDIEDYMEVIIIKDNSQYIWPFEELGMAVLIAPTQRYIEDIMEAFIFKELYDYNISINKA